MQLIDDLVTENAELQQQLQSSIKQLMRKEAELTRAEETIRREQQQKRQLVRYYTQIAVFSVAWGACDCMLWFSWLQETERDELIQAKDRELAQIQEHLRQLRQQVFFIIK